MGFVVDTAEGVTEGIIDARVEGIEVIGTAEGLEVGFGFGYFEGLVKGDPLVGLVVGVGEGIMVGTNEGSPVGDQEFDGIAVDGVDESTGEGCGEG